MKDEHGTYGTSNVFTQQIHFGAWSNVHMAFFVLRFDLYVFPLSNSMPIYVGFSNFMQLWWSSLLAQCEHSMEQRARMKMWNVVCENGMHAGLGMRATACVAFNCAVGMIARGKWHVWPESRCRPACALMTCVLFLWTKRNNFNKMANG